MHSSEEESNYSLSESEERKTVTFEPNITTAAKYMIDGRLVNIIMVLQDGFVFLLDTEVHECIKMVDIQFDIVKVIRYSKNQNFMAIKLQQPLDGEDHLILQCNDRSNVIVYITHLGIQVVNQDEFSILLKSKPVWFRFAELNVERQIIQKLNQN